ncbi:MAG: hypothetical protein ACPG32_01720 [Akkermansiaceae bacterium]
MIAEITYHPDWTENSLMVKAYHPLAVPTRIGEARGDILGNGTGFLGDVCVKEEFETRGWFLGLGKRKIGVRDKGVGSKLLEIFESEMLSRGVTQIKGNLTPEIPEKLDWLIQWYQKRGYDFTPDETTGVWAPPGTCGVVSKFIRK